MVIIELRMRSCRLSRRVGLFSRDIVVCTLLDESHERAETPHGCGSVEDVGQIRRRNRHIAWPSQPEYLTLAQTQLVDIVAPNSQLTLSTLVGWLGKKDDKKQIPFPV